MLHGFLKIRFRDDGDGTGKLLVEAQAGGYAGKSGAYFGIEELREFAAALGRFPLPEHDGRSISGGFAETRGKPGQEHVGIDVYPVDRRGHIGIQVRMGMEVWNETRPESQKAAKLEIITTYEPLAKFSKEFLAVIDGAVPEAALEGE